MSELDEHVQLVITRDTLGLARTEFGELGILSHNATFPGRSRHYGGILEVAGDWAVSSPEYRAANAAFAQTPKVSRVAILRATGTAPTMTYQISVAALLNSHDYLVNVVGQGFTDAVATATSDSSATNDEVVAALVTALNGVVGKNYTAAATGSVGSKVVTVTGNSPGAWFSLEVVDVAELAIWQTHADPGITTDLNAIQIADNGWYGLVTLYNSSAYVAAAAAWCESQTKIYIPDCQDTRDITTTVGGGGVLDGLHTLAYSRTAGAYHPSPANMFAAGWFGRVLPVPVGQDDWKFKTIAGVAPVKSTTTHRTNLRARNANSYQSLAGSNRTWEGTTADGDFIDVTRGIDALDDDMIKSVLEALFGPNKTPFTNGGIASIKAAIISALKRSAKAGTLDELQDIVVQAPKVENVSAADKRRRTLPDMKWSATLAGSIHKVTISGTVSV